MANPILKQAVQRKLRESVQEGLRNGAIKMPQIPVDGRRRRHVGQGARWLVWYVLACSTAIGYVMWMLWLK